MQGGKEMRDEQKLEKIIEKMKKIQNDQELEKLGEGMKEVRKELYNLFLNFPTIKDIKISLDEYYSNEDLDYLLSTFLQKEIIKRIKKTNKDDHIFCFKISNNKNPEYFLYSPYVKKDNEDIQELKSQNIELKKIFRCRIHRKNQ